ncbi:MAG: hypothetical protein NT006_03970 [Candidatus Aminicenantes bacterium]|nr:hypothetical protein [Candidatus Aminicenantes bacterium]
MKKTIFWFLAVVITLGSAVYQRITGPTYPLRGKAVVAGTEVKFKLPRSAETVRDAEVRIPAPAPLQGYLDYKRFKTEDAWTRVVLTREGGDLVGLLPQQPAAGKLLYTINLTGGYVTTPVAGEDPVIIRFKDPVPAWIIVPHVLVMFAGMLLSTAAGLAALDKKRNPRRFVLWAVALLFVGGFILGPLVQKFAFGVAWAGFPVGTDLTDNKTLVALLFWIAALIAGRKGKPARPFVLAASLVTLLVYLIPHSVFGSEFDYSKMR